MRTARITGRVALLGVGLVSLYLLLPSLLEVFTSWRGLFGLRPGWAATALALQAASFVCIWELQRIALRARSRFPVATSQLAGNALGRVVPGGAAPAAALQFQMLTRAGVPAGRVASGLAASALLGFGLLLALPVLSLPAILGGTPVDRGLEQTAYLGAALFVLLAAAGAAVLVWDRPLREVGAVVEWSLNRTVRRARPVSGLGARLLAERDAVSGVLGARWKGALAAGTGRVVLDVATLLACLIAVGAEPNPSLVLLAYVTATLLGSISITPGGLGFVEAGLTGTLALAGVGGGAAVLATLAYRLISFWIPIPVGAGAYDLFRRRYPEPAGAAAPPGEWVATKAPPP